MRWPRTRTSASIPGAPDGRKSTGSPPERLASVAIGAILHCKQNLASPKGGHGKTVDRSGFRFRQRPCRAGCGEWRTVRNQCPRIRPLGAGEILRPGGESVSASTRGTIWKRPRRSSVTCSKGWTPPGWLASPSTPPARRRARSCPPAWSTTNSVRKIS